MPTAESPYLLARLFPFNGTVMVETWKHDGPVPSVPNTDAALQALASRGVERNLLPLSDLPKRRNPEMELAFIFHTSRCGSTLASRVLETHPDVVSFSEYGVFSRAVRMDIESGDLDFPIFRACLAAMAPPDQLGPKRMIVRFSSWTSLIMEPLIKAFPMTPWVFIYRNPLEVLVSLRKKPTIWFTQPDWFRAMAPRSLDRGHDPASFAASVLDQFMVSASRAAGAHRLLLNYADFPDVLMQPLFEHVGLTWSSELQEPTMAATCFYSKSGAGTQLPFAPDTATKHREVTAGEKMAARHHAQEAFNDLERLRAQAPGTRIPGGGV